MEWKRLNREDSIRKMNLLRKSGFKIKKFEDMELRNSLNKLMEETTQELGISRSSLEPAGYKADLVFGLKLYEELTARGMNIREASDTGIWRHLSLNVIPDIVYSRWGDSDLRFWGRPRRIWLQALWLYIHLSWQGDRRKTYEILKNNTTDQIVQLVERPGQGYRVDMSREIMNYYGNLNSDLGKKTSSKIYKEYNSNGKNKAKFDLFRKVMKLNTAKSQVIEPGLVEGGVKEYVRGLFEYFDS